MRTYLIATTIFFLGFAVLKLINLVNPLLENKDRILCLMDTILFLIGGIWGLFILLH